MHEQKKPWVPLMMEASYRPSGWLGIMCVPAAYRGGRGRGGGGDCLHLAPSHSLAAASVVATACRLGSRLYFEFTAGALGDGAAWEGLADSVAVEVRRHGAPAPASRRSAPTATAGPAAQVTAQDGVGEAAVAPAMVLAPTALAAAAAARGVAGAAGAGMSSVVHVDNRNNSVNTSNSNSNFGNSNFGNNTSTNNIVLL